MQMTVSVGVNCLATSNTTRCRYCHLCWYNCWKVVKVAWEGDWASAESQVMPVAHSRTFARMWEVSLVGIPTKP